MKYSRPTISIIIPVYNAERYLRRCLDSIIAQTFKDFEVILVNDGSTDESGKICDEYASIDNRINVTHTQNNGASSARNLGLDNAKGKFIAFCDADDYTENNWLSVFMSNISKYDIVISSINQNQNGVLTKRIFPYKVHEVDLTWTILKFEGAPGFLWNKCYRNEIIQKNHIRFNESYKIWEDEEFVSHYFMYAKSAIMTSEITYNYFVPNYDEKYNGLQNISTVIDIFEHTTKFLSIDGPLYHVYSLYIERMFACVRDCYYSKKYRNALENLKKIRNIAEETGLYSLSKTEKLFSINHLVTSHFFYIILSFIHKL